VEGHDDGLGWVRVRGKPQGRTLGSDTICWTQITGFGVRFSISLALPQLWQVGDTYRITFLQLKKATAYSRDAKVDARDKDKG
jgi:hypothetical protein